MSRRYALSVCLSLNVLGNNFARGGGAGWCPQVVGLVAAPDVLVPGDAASVGEAVGLVEPGQMAMVTANATWHGVLDVYSHGGCLAFT